MYKLASAPQPLPGTQLVQRVNGDGLNGLGEYVATPNYFGTPAGQAGIRGLGCGGNCGCSDCSKGMGLFDSGMDYTGWGFGEWAAIGLGVYILISLTFTTSRAGKAIARVPGERRKKKAAALRKRASELERKK